MFRSQLCQQVAPSGTPSQRIAVSRRDKSYPYRPKGNIIVRPKENEPAKTKKYEIDDPGGTGHEIEREIVVCSECASRILKEP